MKFSFIHTADLHIDSPLLGLDKYENSPLNLLRDAPRKAFENLVEFAIEHKVDFIVISGDIFDGKWKEVRTALFFLKQMKKLEKYNIKVYLLQGNHDAENVMGKDIKYPQNVFKFSNDKCSEFIIPDINVRLIGQGYKKKIEKNNLTQNYPVSNDKYFDIGVLHTSLVNNKDDYYAPCGLENLLEKNYDYWALGHIHKRNIVNSSPPIIFPGNIQGRNIKESGKKGFYFVNVENSKIVNYKFINAVNLVWDIINIDCTGLDCEDEILAKIEEEIKKIYQKPFFSVIRINLLGKTKIHKELILNKDIFITSVIGVNQTYEDNIWIEKIIFNTEMEINLVDVLEENPLLKSFVKSVVKDLNTDEVNKLLPYNVKPFVKVDEIEILKNDVKKILEEELLDLLVENEY